MPSVLNIDRLIGIGGVVAGGAVAIYYGRKANKSKGPTFSVQAERELVIRKTVFEYPGFSIKINERELLSDDVVGMKFQFWNSGTLPILSAEVLTPFGTSFPAGCKLLDVRITNVSRPEINASSSIDGTDIILNASILEPEDGMTVRVIYSGPIDAEPTFHGACIGAHSPLVLAPDMVRRGSWWQRSKAYVFGIIPFIVIESIVGGIEGFADSPIAKRHPMAQNAVQISLIGIFGTLFALILGFGIYRAVKKKNLPKALIK